MDMKAIVLIHSGSMFCSTFTLGEIEAILEEKGIVIRSTDDLFSECFELKDSYSRPWDLIKERELMKQEALEFNYDSEPLWAKNNQNLSNHSKHSINPKTFNIS